MHRTLEILTDTSVDITEFLQSTNSNIRSRAPLAEKKHFLNKETGRTYWQAYVEGGPRGGLGSAGIAPGR